MSFPFQRAVIVTDQVLPSGLRLRVIVPESSAPAELAAIAFFAAA